MIMLDEWVDQSLLMQYLPEVWMRVLAGLLLLIVLYSIISWGVRAGMAVVVGRALQAIRKGSWQEPLRKRRVAAYLSHMVALLFLALNLQLMPMSEAVTEGLQRIVLTLSCFYALRCLSAVLSATQDIYEESTRSGRASIKGYIEVARSIMWALGTVVGVSILLDKSPILMLSGLGAISAVLLLVFKDTLLSMVASAQISSNDLLRIGDWISMPQANADGTVIDISLHTVKVENFDKTVTSVPTYKLFSESYKNWRHMFESGGRRIKRTLSIDASTIRFLDDEEIEGLRRFALLDEYLVEKQQELEESNKQLVAEGRDGINRRRLTNIGTFRAYAMQYLKHKKGIHHQMLMMVRMMEPSSEGVPVEVYCFTDDTAWVNYERIQGDVFDHFLSILPEMGLRLYQSPSGVDMREAFAQGANLKEMLQAERPSTEKRAGSALDS
ncbi:mechanosensitive ion channel family protein [Paenalcaligenes sp. Me131]|uniref:mechanosensitive ion channel family protein n=1 Tax=Paenalcaligenes sp. Me131 TaxID=3392636 RepID=UPI003D291F9E